jgi:pyridoxal phosphate enzyme (YggS family)
VLSSIKKDIEDFNKLKNDEISLIVVTKSQTSENISKIVQNGYKRLGENYVDEATKKIEFFNDDSIEWHFIGKIQSNKIKKIVKSFSWVQTVSSIKHAKLLHKACLETSKIMNVCIQVNIDNEPTKSGILLEDVDDFIENILVFDRLVIRGLMAIPSKINALKENINSYKILKAEYDRLSSKYIHMDTLSIGMSNDYKLALDNGSNMIRVGTLIFGNRK